MISLISKKVRHFENKILLSFLEKYLKMDWQFAKELPGIGKYGDDSYKIFCCGLTNVSPSSFFSKQKTSIS